MISTRDNIGRYLQDTKALIRNNNYAICYGSNRQANCQLLMNYSINEYDIRLILLNLTIMDFIECYPNRKVQFQNEIMYVFGKTLQLLSINSGEFETVHLYIKMCTVNAFCTVVSFHLAQYPLRYAFK